MGLRERLKALDAQISQVELKYLKNKVDQVDSQIQGLEVVLYPGSIHEVAERFANCVLSQYERLLTSLCTEMQYNLNVPHLDADDCRQEVMEYMLRWCLPKVAQFSTQEHLWLPYIRRAINNCYVNLLKRHKTESRSAMVVELDDYLIKNYQDSKEDVEGNYEYQDLVTRVMKSLPKMERTILRDILEPPLSMRLFIILKRKEAKAENRKKTSSRRFLAEYYDIPITTVNSVFSRFQNRIHSLSRA